MRDTVLIEQATDSLALPITPDEMVEKLRYNALYEYKSMNKSRLSAIEGRMKECCEANLRTCQLVDTECKEWYCRLIDRYSGTICSSGDKYLMRLLKSLGRDE